MEISAMIIGIVQSVLLVLLGFFLFYLMLLSLLSVFVRLQKNFHTAHQKAFAVVVPAHNEEKVIEKTLLSLFAMEYRRDLFDVIVIADNCTDRTADIARSVGAVVYERSDSAHKGKGYALRWCFDKITGPPFDYDAAIVIDADSTVSKNFLEVMNFYLDRGAFVIQAADIVQPQPGSWSPEVTRIALLLYNYVRPLGKKIFNLSAGLRGNGMCFTTGVLREIPWNAFSITEDLEYGIQLLQKGVRVVFAPEAAVYACMPDSAGNAESQRARWEGGRIGVIKNKAGTLLLNVVRTGSVSFLDMLIDLLMPAYVNMMVVATSMIFLSLFLAILGGTNEYIYALLWLIVVMAGVVHVLVGLVTARADRTLYRALFYLPRYALWKLILYSKLLFRGRPEEWVRTSRE